MNYLVLFLMKLIFFKEIFKLILLDFRNCRTASSKMSTDTNGDQNNQLEGQPLNEDINLTDAVSSQEQTQKCKIENESAVLDRDEILSRRKQKKLLKLVKWEQVKKEKRARERLKAKERRVIAAAIGIPGPNRLRKSLKQNKMENSKNPVRVAIDFDYDELMIDKDIAKCAKQLLRVYTVNRKSRMPIRLYYTSLKEKSRIVEALHRNEGYANWDVYLKQESYLDLFDRESIVYLTSDSDNVLTELDPKAVYIIGGLVDHNHHKGLSFQKADENGLKTARLPLSENISIKTRTVLTIVHGSFQIH